MCLPNFEKFVTIPENKPLIGYRSWRNKAEDGNYLLKSRSVEYIWKELEGPHEVKNINSGIYAYDNYAYNYGYNYYNNYNYYYNYNYLAGIIQQWGKTALHKNGYRSEFAKIEKLFNIRKSDVQGPQKFLYWIDKFNTKMDLIANLYNCKVISWQDFLDEQNRK